MILNKISTKIEKEVQIFHNIKFIIDKIVTDGSLSLMGESIEDIYSREISFATKGQVK